MKRKVSIFALLGLSFMTAIGAISGTIAWLSQTTFLVTNSLFGKTDGAYFAYGKGTADEPYGLNAPRHLYNLAWLNMIGYFDDGQPHYFEIDPKVENGVLDGTDTSGNPTVIPPIGTEEYPFMGSFNGNGMVISNFVVSTSYSDYKQKPYNASEIFTNPEIVGLFGVIGEIDGQTATYTYSGSVPQLYNVGITDLTIKTGTTKALVGVAAGYVNGTIEDVAVNSSEISIDSSTTTTAITDFTSNLSDYGVVGYCTTAYKNSIKQVQESVYSIDVKTPKEFNATDDGDAAGWGGSINMKAMYERLTNITNNAATNTAYLFRTKTTHRANGTSTTTNNNFTANNNGDPSPRRYSPNNTVGNFNLLTRPSPNNVFRYLCGGQLDVDYYYSYYQGSYITDGTNYLYITGGNLGSTTSNTQRLLWTMPDSGSSTISATYNGYTYYLRNNNGTLQVTTNEDNASDWNISRENGTLVISNGGSFLTYSGGFVLQSGYYLLKGSNNQYMNHPTNGNGSITASTSISDTTRWLKNGEYYYYLYNGTRYYLRFRNNNNTANRLVARSGTDYRYHLDSSGRLYASYGYNYYAYLNGATWTADTDSSRAVIFTEVVERPTINLTDNKTPTTESYLDDSRTTSKMTYTSTNTTYFPLNVVSDGGTANNTATINSNYAAKDSNTGYVVAGSLIDEDSDLGYADGSKTSDTSRIRVSQYEITNISNSYSSSDGSIRDAKVYTFNSSGSEVTMQQSMSNGDTYEKYSTSKSSFYTSALKSSSYVYGLHFMASQISMDDIVEARNIQVNGVTTPYATYQLPVNSIDFNLKEKGYINFFAGTYFSGNDSFFSLHQVYRNGSNGITEIKEIAEIFGNKNKHSYSYAYKFTDGTYSKPYRFDAEGHKYEMSSNDTGTAPYVESHSLSGTDFQTYKDTYGYTSVFDTVRITNYRNGSRVHDITTKRLYYFEIPMNDGEYCLGSVNGGTGGYLLYLDIAANAMKVQRTEIYERFKAVEKEFSYPKGISLIEPEEVQDVITTTDPDTGATSTVTKIVVDPLDTALTCIVPGYSGTVSMTRDENDNVVIGGESQTKAYPTLVGLKIKTIKDGDGTNVLPHQKASSTKTTDIWRMQYYDWKVQYGTLQKTIITDTSVNGGTKTRTVEQFDVATDGKETAVETIKVYNSDTGILITNPTSQTALPLNYNPTTTILTFSYNSGTYTIVRTLEMTQGTAGEMVAFTFKDYKFTFQNNNGTIEVVVNSVGSGTFYIGTTQVTTVGQVITISNP